VTLGNIGNVLGKFPGFKLRKIGTSYFNLPLLGLVDTQDAIDQGSFTAAIGADDAKDLTGVDSKTDVLENQVVRVITKAKVF